MATLFALAGQRVLSNRGQAKQASGNETKARASCGGPGEGFRHMIEIELVHGGTSSCLHSLERFEAVLPLQQPPLARAVNGVTSCRSIRWQEWIRPEFLSTLPRLERRQIHRSSSSARAAIMAPEAVTATAARAGANWRSAGPATGEGAPLQEATGVKKEESDAGQGGGQPQAEGHHYQQSRTRRGRPRPNPATPAGRTGREGGRRKSPRASRLRQVRCSPSAPGGRWLCACPPWE